MKELLTNYSDSCKIGVFAYNGDHELFSYNENTLIDGACTLKVFIMLDYVRQIADGLITGNELVKVSKENYAAGAGTIKYLSEGVKVKASDLVELMVAISDHTAANIMIDFLGLEHINNTISYYGFRNTKLFGKYLVPKAKNVSQTTAYDYAEFFRKLDNNMLVNEYWCGYMKEILKSQRYKNFLAFPLFKYSDQGFIDMQCKTGKVNGNSFEPVGNSVINDGGICITSKGNYYISFLSEIFSGSDISSDEMIELMHMISEKILKRYLKI